MNTPALKSMKIPNRPKTTSARGIALPVAILSEPDRIQRITSSQPNAGNHYLDAHVARLLTSFRHWTGKDLIGPSLSPETQARALFYAPFAILSHDTAPDPILNYANQTGLRLFGLNWDELITMPSRLTAQALEQAERAGSFRKCPHEGYIDDYRGIRVTKTVAGF